MFLHRAIPRLIHMIMAEDGQGIIEYALIAALISIAAIAVISLIGPALPALYQVPLNDL